MDTEHGRQLTNSTIEQIMDGGQLMDSTSEQIMNGGQHECTDTVHSRQLMDSMSE
jgi:hypothetical protein